MTEGKLVPKIRFKEFEDEWKENLINNVTTTKSGGTPSVSNKGFYIGNIPFIRSSDINKTYTELKINNEAISNSSTFIVKKGNILYALYGATSGKVAISKITGAINQAVLAIFPKPFIDKYFLMYWLANNKQRIIDKYLQGGQGNLSAKIIKKLILKFPSKSEQQKIGDLFAKLDRLLDLQQQKLDQLELLKKALLQKLFPKHGAKIPELRFKGFEEEWKQKKFSDLYKKRSEKNDHTFGPDKIISVANMYFKQTETRSDEKYMKTYNIFHLGDIAFEGNKSKRFSFGRFVENTIGDGIVSHVFEVFKPTSSYDLNYWKYGIHNEDFMGPTLRKSTIKATMMSNLITKDFLKQKITVPTLSEQQKIGTLLTKVDRLIELENNKSNNLKLVKKSLLQNMFVE